MILWKPRRTPGHETAAELDIEIILVHFDLGTSGIAYMSIWDGPSSGSSGDIRSSTLERVV